MTLLSIKRAAPAQNRRERRARSVSSPSPLIASRVIEDFHMISEHLNVVQEGKNIYPYGAVYVLKRAPFFISLRNEAKDPAIAFCRTNRLNEFLLARGSNEYWGRVGDGLALSRYEPSWTDPERIAAYSDAEGRDQFAALLSNDAVPLLRQLCARHPDVDTALAVPRTYLYDYQKSSIAIFAINGIPMGSYPDNQVFVSYFHSVEIFGISAGIHLSRMQVHQFSIVFG